MKRTTLLTIACIAWLSMACERNFDTINKNPNLIDQISPGTLLNEIIYNMASTNLRNNYNITCQLMQVQLSYPQYYGGVQRYEILENTGLSQWNASYKWAKNVSEMLAAAETDGASNYISIALTLRAWIYANLTDIFGDVPFSEASQAENGILQPAYDSQADIYTQLLTDLERANSLYNHEVGMSYGTDILFENDTHLWQKFTNSLRLRLLLRTSNVDPSAYGKMVAIITNPASSPIIDHVNESAVFHVTGITPNISPWSRALDFSNQHAVSAFFIDILNKLNDPRRPVFVGQARAEGADIGYKGIPSGYDESSFSYSPSYMNNQQVIPPMQIPILTYAEVAFIKAELAQKGHLSGAEDFYKEGIRAAIRMVTGEDIEDTYFLAPMAIYDGSLSRIMLHKYLALYFTDFQQWSEYRRTGYPVLPKTNSMLNDGILPSRLLYPGIQQIYNPENYQAAAERMGGDDINFKLWWDVN
ncbi:SusD/RagB family nutrient-binding outer membrane lipoprotein [Parapedobacter sp.]